jgi:hypothetical protein
MLRDAHKGAEVMNGVAAAVKDERWGDASMGLEELQKIATKLMREIGDKQREAMLVPKPDQGDRE